MLVQGQVKFGIVIKGEVIRNKVVNWCIVIQLGLIWIDYYNIYQIIWNMDRFRMQCGFFNYFLYLYYYNIVVIVYCLGNN